jgi:hypothetical protein
MNRLIARSRALLVIVVLATAAAMCTVSTAHAAAPAVAASPAAQCVLDPVLSCQSTNPTVVLDVYYPADQTGCLYTFYIYWGDGKLTQLDVLSPPSNSWALLAQHTYSTPREYTITVSVSASVGCQGNDWTDDFAYLAPAPTNYQCSCVLYVRDTLLAQGIKLAGGPGTAAGYTQSKMHHLGWSHVRLQNNGTFPDGNQPMVAVWDAGAKGADKGAGHMAIVVNAWAREWLGAKGKSPWYNYRTKQWNITVMQVDWPTGACAPAGHVFTGPAWGNLYGVNFYVPA